MQQNQESKECLCGSAAAPTLCHFIFSHPRTLNRKQLPKLPFPLRCEVALQVRMKRPGMKAGSLWTWSPGTAPVLTLLVQGVFKAPILPWQLRAKVCLCRTSR